MSDIGIISALCVQKVPRLQLFQSFTWWSEALSATGKYKLHEDVFLRETTCDTMPLWKSNGWTDW